MSHLPDGGAELALEHLLQGLELVCRDVARLLQLLQQLDGSGNIWGREGKGQGRPRTPFIPLSQASAVGTKARFDLAEHLR